MNDAQKKFPGLTLMQCGVPEDEGMYLCLVKNHLGLFWEKVELVEDSLRFMWFNRAMNEIVAWQPLPPIPTEEELEQLYKAPIPNDE